MAAIKEIRSLKKEVRKEVEHLRDLYAKIDRMEKKQGRRREHGLDATESELKEKFPDESFDRCLLKLVGMMPYRNPPSKDKDLIARAIAENYE